MSRGSHNFRQADVTKAIKAAAASGLKDWRVEVADGKIVISPGDERRDSVDERKPNEWD
jgi:hypothetical protein